MVGGRFDRHRPLYLALILLWLFLLPLTSYPWGREGHVAITNKAIDILSGSLKELFDLNRDELIRLSNVPDWEWKENPDTRYTATWHYLDIDKFDFKYPFEDFPRDKAELKKLYEERGEAGYLPWTIADYYVKLVRAFKKGDLESIIYYAGIVSHFIGDSTMPLHCTRNYNGAFSGNYKFAVPYDSPDYAHKGVHQRFEIGLMERYLEGYRAELNERKLSLSRLPEDKLEYAFQIIVESFYEVDQIIYFDKAAMRAFKIKPDLEEFKSKSDKYYAFMDRHVGSLLVERLSRASEFLASFWYSAWLEAGGPRLKTGKIKIEKVSPR
jgi:hypothetical protein